MNVIVHKPQTVEGNKTLQNRLALAHAEMMKDYIFKLPWEANRKVTLYEAVKDKIRAEAEKEKEGGERMEEFFEEHPILGAVAALGMLGIWYMVLWLI